MRRLVAGSTGRALRAERQAPRAGGRQEQRVGRSRAGQLLMTLHARNGAMRTLELQGKPIMVRDVDGRRGE
jgi:hypothetical protein